MSATATKVNLLGLDREGLETFFIGLGEKRFRATQLLKWIYQLDVDDFESMSNIAKALRRRLGELAEIREPTVVTDRLSSDGTRKWVLRLDDGNAVETVFIPEEDRGTLCVSSQVGCSLDCGFCSTARQGYNRNLTSAEIIAQLRIASRLLERDRRGDRAVTNVVLMGMGEPLLNFDNAVSAMHIMLDDNAYGLSKRRITLSTAGVVPAIDRLSEVCGVSLAISLHATNDELRDRIVPINRKYPIAALLDACRRYTAIDGRRRITVEYIMLAGVNDSVAEAHELVRLLRGIPVKLNLIPFNPFPGSGFERSSPRAQEAFRKVLIDAGLTTITRKTRGDDIDAACGQLAGQVMDRTRRQQRYASNNEATQ